MKRRKIVPFLAGFAAFFILFFNIAPVVVYASVGAWGGSVQPWGGSIEPWGGVIDGWEDSVDSWDAEPWDAESNGTVENGNDPVGSENPNDPNNSDNSSPDSDPNSQGPSNDDFSTSEGGNNPEPPGGPSLYDINKYLQTDVIGGTFKYMEKNNIQNPGELINDFRKGGPLAGNLAFSTFKLGVKGNAFGESIGDSVDTGIKINEARQKFIELRNYRKTLDNILTGQGTLQEMESLSDIKKGLQATHFAPVSKLNAGVAAVSAAYSAYETGQNIGKLVTADTSEERWLAGGSLGQSLGDTLMNASIVAGATGVGAPIAAGIFIAGAALWTAGTVTKLVVNWDSTVKSAKKVWGKAKDTVSSIANKGKSLVESVSSWFS